MDADLWKLLVDKAVLRTKTRDLIWSETSEGPAKTLSFGTSIDDSTTLNIWGYEANYSYELCLIKETTGEPFEERKRATTKKNADGVNFSGLFEAAQLQIKALTRDRAFAAVMEYLADPGAVEDPEKQDELRDQWGALGDYGYFLYSHDEKILAAVRDMTAAGSITWSLEDGEDRGEEGQYFRAEIGDLLCVRLHPSQTPRRTLGSTSYRFGISGTGDEPFDVEVDLSPDAKKHTRPLWLIADELSTLISNVINEDEKKFNQIVRDNIIHDILASLDDVRQEPSLPDGV
ncbi:hypothetical protein [Arthrobacter sp. NPDC058192]|uniref:hypothetical protein n=1 Tax=Arthrobacter sp. NPDC058192 TaxID=3346372 RepID=UPI0036E2964A